MFNGSHNEIVRYMKKMYLYDFYFKIITTDQNAYNYMEKKFSELDQKYGTTRNNFQSFYARFEIINFMADMYWQTYSKQLYGTTLESYFKKYLRNFAPKTDDLIILKNYLNKIPFPDNEILLESLKRVHGNFSLNLNDFISTKDYLELKTKNIGTYLYNMADLIFNHGERLGINPMVIHGATYFLDLYFNSLSIPTSNILQFVRHGIHYYNRLQQIFLPLKKYNDLRAQDLSNPQIFYHFLSQYGIQHVASSVLNSNVPITNIGIDSPPVPAILPTNPTGEIIRSRVQQIILRRPRHVQAIVLQHTRNLYLPHWFYRYIP
jgi:hypothetical protein